VAACALFRSFGIPVLLSAVAASLFAFPNNLFLSVSHIQLFTLYVMPAVGWACVVAVRTVHVRPRRAAMVAALGAFLFGLAFATGYYMSWLFQFQVAIFVALLGLFAWPEIVAWWRAGPRRVLVAIAAYAAGFAAGLVPFAAIYLPVLSQTGGFGAGAYRLYAADPSDLLNLGPGNLVWGSLVAHSGLIDQARLLDGEHRFTLTPAVIVLLLAAVAAAIAAPRLWRVDRAGRLLRAVTLAGGLTVVVFYATVIAIDGWSLFTLLQRVVPGASAIRVGYRGMLTASLFELLAISIVADRVIAGAPASPRYAARVAASGFALLLFVALVEQVNLEQTSAVSRPAELARLAHVPPAPRECRTMYVVDEPAEANVAKVHVDAMQIAVRDMIPTVAGYSGILPPHWTLFDIRTPGFDRRVADYARRRGFYNGLCRLDFAAGEWRLVSESTEDLALRNARLPPLDFSSGDAVSLSFAAPDVVGSFLGEGWWQAESWGRWSADRHAYLAIPLGDARPQAVDVDLRVVVTRKLGRRTVRLTVNGCTLAAATIRHGQSPDITLSGTLPPACTAGPGALVVGLETDEIAIPAELGVNGDGRTLGIGVRRIVLKR